MANWSAPESAANSKEKKVNKALSARRKPPRLVWSEERERKRTLALSECRNAGAERERERRRRAENRAAASTGETVA